MSEDGISVTMLSDCCATTATANRSRVDPTVVECMVKVNGVGSWRNDSWTCEQCGYLSSLSEQVCQSKRASYLDTRAL